VVRGIFSVPSPIQYKTLSHLHFQSIVDLTTYFQEGNGSMDADKHAWVLQNSEIMEDSDVSASCDGVFEGVQRTRMDHAVRTRNEICTAQVPRFFVDALQG